MRSTDAGLILGTAGYMSPEQAAGKPVDRRADIWSFGVVLWELLTGRRLFDGETVTHTLAGVVRAPIHFSVLPKETPPEVRRLLRRCLDRNLKKRLRDIGEARVALEQTAESEVASVAASRWWPWVAGTLALALLFAAVGWYNAARPSPLRPLMRLNVEIAPGIQLARADAGGSVGGNMFAISPDGARLALTLRSADGKARIHTRLPHQSQVVPLAGTENAHSPFFSPGGDWIGFFAEGKRKKISVEGGAAATLCDAPVGVGASWGDDGAIIAALSNTGVLWRISSAGGIPVPVTRLNAGEVSHRWPQVIPGTHTVLFTAAVQIGAGYDDANIDAVSLKTGDRITVRRGGFYPYFLGQANGSNSTGHLISLHQSTLFAVPFHPGRLASDGAPVPILEGVSNTQAAGGDFAVTQGGTFIYLPGKSSPPAWPITWVDSVGNTKPLHAPPGQYYYPRFSPDGKRLAFSMNNGKGQDIWVKDLTQDTPSRLSFLPGTSSHPVWTPDGKHILFRSLNQAAPGLYRIRADGSGEAKRLTDGRTIEYPSSFSPDGKRLAIFQAGNGGSFDIFTMPIEADPGPEDPGFRLGKPEVFLGTPFLEVYPAFSPDGRWLAYASNESGTQELYVRPFPGPGGRWQVSTDGGRLPLWSRDGRELLVQSLDLRLNVAATTATGNLFAPGKPRVWSETRLRNASFERNFDLAPDGKRLAAILAADANGEKPPTHLTFLLHFFDELRRKASAGR